MVIKEAMVAIVAVVMVMVMMEGMMVALANFLKYLPSLLEDAFGHLGSISGGAS